MKKFFVSTLLMLLIAAGYQRMVSPAQRRPGNNIAVNRTAQSSTTLLLQSGGRLDWLGNRIAYDAVGPDGYYHVYVMGADGSHQACLTCSATALPVGEHGNPAWHPSGEYIVFEGEKAVKWLGKRSDYLALPGFGINDDVWLINSTGTRCWKLVATKPVVGGVLHPHFSRDGRRLLWTERLSNGGGSRNGIWALRVADFFSGSSGPHLSNVQTLQPLGAGAVYESHGFSHDGSKIIFTGSVLGQTWGNTNIYTYDLPTASLIKVTNDKHEWNEHAHYSPDGRMIVWASSGGLSEPRDKNGNIIGSGLHLDLWLMNADGSNKRRMTYFNDPRSAEYIPGGAATSDNDWSSDGSQVAVYVITNQTRQLGQINLVQLPGGLH